MCRHFAYLGPPVSLRTLLYDPPHGLVRQSYQPRRQRNGLLNADGFGVGWYPDRSAAPTPGPLRYRRSVPIWGEDNLVELAGTLHSGAVLASVRSATAGHPVTEGAVAPFRADQWLFSHNGALPGWPRCAREMVGTLEPEALLDQATVTDSTVLWALILQRLRRGEDPARVVGEVTALARRRTGGRVNLLLHDGQRIIATAAGDTLCYLTGHHPDPDGVERPGVFVASEPFDDSSDWADVPEDSVLVATAEQVTVVPLPTAARHHVDDLSEAL